MGKKGPDGMGKQERHLTYVNRTKWLIDLLDSTAPDRPVRGVEIGVWKSDFAYLSLPLCKRLQWYGVDPYGVFGRRPTWRPIDWDDLYNRVIEKMQPYIKEGRYVPVRLPSESALPYVPDDLDFIFIDGNHDYEYVKFDLENWERKVRVGGIISGHDYKLSAVQKAVKEYADQNGYTIVMTNFDPYIVWYWIKEAR